MTILTVTAKGQVTLRKEVLRHLGVGPGDKIAVDLLPERRIEVCSVKSTGEIDGFFGCLRRRGARSLSLEDIARVASEGWAAGR
ncbi:MAG TPA: AbrB/MazE/SpoVT family DNA-binding domain-containing protein [Roseiarcus sp.]|nr:AbrB/MazE/SpoVT family DNA-binding domain-containing protein [Roseiarcus sp.]